MVLKLLSGVESFSQYLSLGEDLELMKTPSVSEVLILLLKFKVPLPNASTKNPCPGLMTFVGICIPVVAGVPVPPTICA